MFLNVTEPGRTTTRQRVKVGQTHGVWQVLRTLLTSRRYCKHDPLLYTKHLKTGLNKDQLRLKTKLTKVNWCNRPQVSIALLWSVCLLTWKMTIWSYVVVFYCCRRLRCSTNDLIFQVRELRLFLQQLPVSSFYLNDSFDHTERCYIAYKATCDINLIRILCSVVLQVHSCTSCISSIRNRRVRILALIQQN